MFNLIIKPEVQNGENADRAQLQQSTSHQNARLEPQKINKNKTNPNKWKARVETKAQPLLSVLLSGEFSALISSRWAHLGIYGQQPVAACCCITQPCVPAGFTVTQKSEINGKACADAATRREFIPLIQVAVPERRFDLSSAWFSPAVESNIILRRGKLSPLRKWLVGCHINV